MLEGRHYQNAYVTRNIAKWVDAFRGRADVRKLIEYEGTNEIWTPNGMQVQTSKLAFIWVEDLQYELIEPVTTGNIYSDALPDDDSLKFHHICMRVPEWEGFRARVDAQDLPVVLERATDPALRFLYLDGGPLVGHYLEYVCCSDERWGQMGGR